jgi:hypothetical protein
MSISHSLHGSVDGLNGSPIDRLMGMWSARAIVAFSVPYAITMVLGFISLGNLRDPLSDPYLGVAEILIILMAPFMVTLMVALHSCAPKRFRSLSLTALGWMFITASVTMTVHFVELVYVRRINPADIPGFLRLLNFQWPSLLYAVDIAAWDLFLGLALLFAAPVFSGPRYRWSRRGLIASGSLCLIALAGPALNVLALRSVGIFGYAIVFPITCVAISRNFANIPTPIDEQPAPAEPLRIETSEPLVPLG